jgi:hypothetical protein
MVEQFTYLILIFRTPVRVRGHLKLLFKVVLNDFLQKGAIVELLAIFPFNLILGNLINFLKVSGLKSQLSYHLSRDTEVKQSPSFHKTSVTNRKICFNLSWTHSLYPQSSNCCVPLFYPQLLCLYLVPAPTGIFCIFNSHY